MAKNEHGAVFTRGWVVDLILDSCGYLETVDLARRVAVEPSCGDGAFLVPMIQRLARSARLHGRCPVDAMDAVVAFDVQQRHVDECRRNVTEALQAEGWDAAESVEIAAHWIRCADYLLVDNDAEADFVIGNPPYIRSDDLERGLRERYMSRCPSMTIGSDIFIGFIEAGLRSLAPGGALAFIVADRWMHNAYGRKLRGVVAGSYAVEAVIEMHGVDAFADEVSAYPAITQIRRGKQGRVLYATAHASFDAQAASRLVAWRRSAQATGPESVVDHTFRAAILHDWFHTDDGWPSASPDRLELLERLESEFPPLQDAATGTRVGIGIATGADGVFLLSGTSPDIEPDRLVPIVTTKHVSSGQVRCDMPVWLVNPWTPDGTLVDLTCFPRMAAYLAEHRELLERRHTAQKSPKTTWYRTIDKVHAGLAKRPKLLLQDMKASIQPVHDEGDYYPHHNLYWITSDVWDLKVLGGLLLSRVAQMFVEAYGVKMRGGTLRFQAQYLRKIRVPRPEDIDPKVASRLAEAFEMRDSDAATEAALSAYGMGELPD